MSQHLRHSGRRCRMAALFASLPAVAAAAAGMQASTELPGPEFCDIRPFELREGSGVAPNLIGMTREQAEARVQQAFHVEVVEVRSREPRGMVVNQWPKPDHDTAWLVLCVSNGEAPPPIRMPNLAGRTLEQARQALAARQIANAPTVRRAENPEPSGTVYGQSPAAGAVVTADDAVVLNVSDGPPPTPAEPAPVEPIPAASTPAEPAAVEPIPAASTPPEPAVTNGFAPSAPPPSAAQRDFTRIAIPGLLLAIALLAAALMTRSYLSQRRPRFRVRMAGLPMASVDWGDPPEPGFECRLVPPIGRCRVERDEGARADG